MKTDTSDFFRIGFVPLTDSAPLVVAKEKGFFSKYGIEVDLLVQNSWATLRDKLHMGMLDAAQMLAPMPIASALGLGTEKTDLIAPMVLSLNGNGITLSSKLYKETLACNKLPRLTFPMAAYLLRNVAEKRRKEKAPKLRFAHVFPYSCHFYQLQDWLESGGLTSEDVELMVIPPVNMVDYLRQGDIDGFCVGGPWNAKAVRAGMGVTALTSYDIWQDSPEKVLGLRADLYEKQPAAVERLCLAVKQACDWLESVPNRFEAARLLSLPHYLDAPLDVIAPSLIGSCLTTAWDSPRNIPGYNQFSSSLSDAVNKPEWVRGEWLLKQMVKSGQVNDIEASRNVVTRVFRPDIYQRVVAQGAVLKQIAEPSFGR